MILYKNNYKKIKKYIVAIKRLAQNSHHMSIEESADRGYIFDYVISCIPFVRQDSEILEFDGGIVYADQIKKIRGGNVKYATKKGRLDRNNQISFEFDINYEIINEKFDLIIATQLLGSFINPIKIMRQLKKMLKPSGVLIVTVSGPSYPKIPGLISFYSKEGLTQIGRRVFGVKNIKNVRSYGNLLSAFCMLDYLSNKIMDDDIKDDKYQHEVINGIVCVNE